MSQIVENKSGNGQGTVNSLPIFSTNFLEARANRRILHSLAWNLERSIRRSWDLDFELRRRRIYKPNVASSKKKLRKSFYVTVDKKHREKSSALSFLSIKYTSNKYTTESRGISIERNNRFTSTFVFVIGNRVRFETAEVRTIRYSR